MSSFYSPGIYALESGGWAYAPWGDIYALTPLWGESHALTGETINVEDEVNRYAIVAQYDTAIDPYFILTVTQDDPDTPTVLETAIPEGSPEVQSRIWLNMGFNETRQLSISQVMDLDEDDEEFWTGKFKVTFPEAIRTWVGVGRVANFSLDYWTTEEPETRVRLAFGTVVFRR